ncbi:MAG TPA: RNA polymerase sigma factor [Solirubrobacteraceae bacterium]|nr:RNA polymerase sigma factor [Solirubrobacteraceae bacterium]
MGKPRPSKARAHHAAEPPISQTVRVPPKARQIAGPSAKARLSVGLGRDRGPAVAWLIGIARHLLIDATRRGQVDHASRRRLGMERISFEQHELELVERDSASELERALARLPAEQRQAIEKRVLEEEPYAVVAAAIGCSEQVVRKRVSRGLATLRRAVKEKA